MTRIYDSPLDTMTPPDLRATLYEFSRFVTESWDDEFPGHPFTVDPESSRLAVAADIAELIASNRLADAHGIAAQTQGGERLAAALRPIRNAR